MLADQLQWSSEAPPLALMQVLRTYRNVFRMAPVIASSCYRTAVQLLSVYF